MTIDITVGGGAATTQEEIEDIVAALVAGGSAVSVNYDDANDTLTLEIPTDGIGTDELDQSAPYTFTGGPTFDKYTDFAEPGSSPTHQEGRVFYDNDENALSYFNEDASVTIAMGREVVTRVRNETGSTISNGDVVYVTGAHSGSGTPTVGLAQADDLVTADVIGMVTGDIANNDYGYVTTAGVVHELDTSAFSAGDVVYLSPSTPGGVTTTEPSSPDFSVEIGVVTQSSASAGNIMVQAGETRDGIYTQGGVPFADSTGKLIENSASLFWDNANNRLGVGTNSPGSALDVAGSIAVSGTVDGVDVSAHAGDEDTHHVRGGFSRGDVTSTSVTASAWDSLWVDTATAGGAVTVTLPADGDTADGDRVEIGIEDGTNDTTISANTGQSILGSPTTLKNAGETIMLEYKNSTSVWMIRS